MPQRTPARALAALRAAIARRLPRRWLRVEPADVSPAEERAFEAVAREITAANVPIVVLLVAGLVLLWWPVDAIVFAGQPAVKDVFAAWRGVTAAVLLASLAVAWATGSLARAPRLYGALVIVAGFAVTAWFMGRAGTVEDRWFAYFLAAPLFTVLILLPLPARLAVNFGLLGATWAAFVAAQPEALGYAPNATALSTFVFTALFGTFAGHVGYLAQRASVTAAARLRRSEAHVRELAATLEARVAERTAQLRTARDAAMAARASERAWVVRELHDALGQELTALHYGLSLLRGRVGDAVASNAFTPLEELLRRASETTRRLLHGLAAAPATDAELHAWLEEILDTAREVAGLDGRLEADAASLVGLPEALRLAVYRVVQEATTNVLRHAGARALVVSVAREAAAVVVRVEDDGAGMGSAPDGAGGLGVVGIRQRAAELGGEAAWRARPGGGTTLEVRLPWPT